MSLTFLVLREGSHYHLPNSLFSYAQLLSGRSNIFRVGFPPQSSRIILTTQTQIHHFIEDNIPNFPIRKLLLRISDMNPLNEYYK